MYRVFLRTNEPELRFEKLPHTPRSGSDTGRNGVAWVLEIVATHGPERLFDRPTNSSYCEGRASWLIKWQSIVRQRQQLSTRGCGWCRGRFIRNGFTRHENTTSSLGRQK